MSSGSRGSAAVKQENFNHVNPQVVFSQQQQQQQQQRQSQRQGSQPNTQANRPTPMMFMQSNSSALQHQYVNEDSLGSNTFGDSELAESLGYGNLTVDTFSYNNSNGNGYDGYDGEHARAGGKPFPMQRLQGQNNNIYAGSASEFASFSPDYGSPAPIPFNRARPGAMTSMSLPQFGPANALHNHAAIMIGAGSVAASPSTPGFVGSFGGTALSYGEMDGDNAKYLALLGNSV
jgi:hypothetical protein